MSSIGTIFTLAIVVAGIAIMIGARKTGATILAWTVVLAVSWSALICCRSPIWAQSGKAISGLGVVLVVMFVIGALRFYIRNLFRRRTGDLDRPSPSSPKQRVDLPALPPANGSDDGGNGK